MSALERLARALCKGYAQRLLVDNVLGWKPGPEALQSYVDRRWQEWLWAAELAVGVLEEAK